MSKKGVWIMPQDLTEIKRRLKAGKPNQRDWQYLAMSLHALNSKDPMLPKIIKVLARDIQTAKKEYYPELGGTGVSFLDDEMYDLYEKTLRVLNPKHKLLQKVGS